MKIALVGSRFFGAAAFEALRKEQGVEFSSVVVPAADDRLALAAKEAGLPVHVLANPKMVPGEAVPAGNGSHRRRAYACARERRGARPLAPGRRRLPPVVVAAASRHRSRRVDDQGRRPDRRRLGLSPGRRLGQGRHRRPGVVLRRAGRDGARAVGARAGPDRPRAPPESRAIRPGARPRAEQAAGSALRDQGADDSQAGSEAARATSNVEPHRPHLPPARTHGGTVAAAQVGRRDAPPSEGRWWRASPIPRSAMRSERTREPMRSIVRSRWRRAGSTATIVPISPTRRRRK